MKKPQGLKPHKEAHVANTKYGSGDYYGTGIKNPIGKMRYDSMTNSMPKKSGKAPNSLA